MKRILTPYAALPLLIVTIFFTGCNSLTGSLEVNTSEIEQSIAESSSISITPTPPTVTPPDFFAQNMEEKFQHLSAPRAFQLKSDHSQSADDIESFQIGALLEDDTFVYAYSTRLRDGEKPRDMVHCAAFYSYAAGELKVFHENRFGREWETSEDMAAKDIRDDEEAFFIQVCNSGERGREEIFIYDNGEAYLYRRDGTQKLHVDIAAFIRLQYPDVHSVSVIHALTDGENRIYLELSIEKEAVNIPEEESDAEENPKDPEKTEEEIEALDQETQDKVENVILVYEVHSLQPELHQENEHFVAQVNAWITKADGLEFEEGDEPDSEADWESAIQEFPDQWSGADIVTMENMAVYEWKNDAVFLYQDGVCTFIPDANAYQPFVNLVEGWEFLKQFIPYENHYSRLYGKVGPVRYDEEETFSRTFTVVSAEESGDGEGESEATGNGKGESEATGIGSEVMMYLKNLLREGEGESKTAENEGEESETGTQTREITQNIVLDTRHRYAPLNNAYLESYWIMDKERAAALGNALGKDILCTNEKGEVCWILPGSELEKIGEFEENQQIYALQDGDYAFLLSCDTEGMKIQTDRRHTKENLPEVEEKIDYQKLAGVAQPGSSVYDQYFQQKNQEQIAGEFDGYGGIYLTGDQLLRIRLSLDAAVVSALIGLGQDVFMPSEHGYLLTVQDKGLIYYDALQQKSMILLEGSWYRSWKKGNQYVSVGFSGSASYGEMDIAFSRVYTYNLDDMVNGAMKNEMESLLEQKKKEEELKQSQAQAEADSESMNPEETIEDMNERWNREHPQDKREKEASEALEKLIDDETS